MIAGLRSVLHFQKTTGGQFRLRSCTDWSFLGYTLPWTWLAAGASIRQRAVQFWKFSLSPRPPGGLENICPWHSCAASDQPTRTLGCQVYKKTTSIKLTITPWRQQSTQTSKKLRIHLNCTSKTMPPNGWIHLNELKQLICEALVRCNVSLHG